MITKRLVDESERFMSFNTYLGDICGRLTMREEDGKKLKAKLIKK